MSVQTPIYLDYSATTPVDPRVRDAMMGCLTFDGTFGNPASRSHTFGWEAERLVEIARHEVAELIHADHREIVWTAGATEASNLAIKGIAQFHHKKGTHIVTDKIEHKSVLDTCRALESDGFTVTYIDPDADGCITPESVAAAITDETTLVSIMHANNEIGVINDVGAIGALCREKGVYFHVDAAQTAGKIPIDVEAMQIDVLSVSGHKMYAPKGIGFLFVRRNPRVRLKAQMHGGGHERGMRSGTLPTHQIVGLGTAARIAREEMADEAVRIRALRDRLYEGLSSIEAVRVNGSLTDRLPGSLNISFNYIEGEALMMAIKDVAVSSGSACTSASLEPSYVLRAIGLSDELAHSSIRFSIGKYSTEAEIDYVVALIQNSVGRLRDMSPLWEMYKKGIDLNTVQWAAH